MPFESELSVVGSSSLSTATDVADVVGTLVTSAAIVIGGLWAYFKFWRGRQLPPKLVIDMFGEWISEGLWVRVQVSNIGSQQVEFSQPANVVQRGTGLRISTLDEHSANSLTPEWTIVGPVFEIHERDEWVYPGETIHDEVLIPGIEPQAVLVEVRLVLDVGKPHKQVAYRRKVFPRQSAKAVEQTSQ